MNERLFDPEAHRADVDLIVDEIADLARQERTADGRQNSISTPNSEE